MLKKGTRGQGKERKKPGGDRRRERPFQFEALEPRLYLSAELGILPDNGDGFGDILAPVVENVDRFNDVTTTPAGDGLEDATAGTADSTEPDDTTAEEAENAEAEPGTEATEAPADTRQTMELEEDAGTEDSVEAPAVSVETTELEEDVGAQSSVDLSGAEESGPDVAPAGEGAVEEPLLRGADAALVMNSSLNQVVIIDSSVKDQEILITSLADSRENVNVIYCSAQDAFPASSSSPAETAAGTVSLFDDSLSVASSEAVPSAPLSAGPVFDVYILEGGRDGIEQVTAILGMYDNLDAVHILSHGAMGMIRLGSTVTTGDKLKKRTADVAAWGQALTPGGDILLYGCDVGAGDAGAAFVEKLASLTGADVAASDNATGAEAYAGDWLLEVSTGTVETMPLVFGEYQRLLFSLSGTADDDILYLDNYGDGDIDDGWMRYSFDGENWSPFTFTDDILEIDLLTGDDRVEILGFDTSITGGITLIGADEVTISVSEGVLLCGINLTVEATGITIATGTTVNTGTGSITFAASDSQNAFDASSEASITIDGVTLIGGDITITAASTVSGSSSSPLAVVDVDSQALVSIVDTRIESSGSLTISAASILTATAEAEDPGFDSVGADAAVAMAFAAGTASAFLSGTSSVETSGSFSISATNTITVTAAGDASSASAGGALGLAVVSGITEAYIDSTGTISVGDLGISATSTVTVTTTAKASPGGASDSGAKTESQEKLDEYNAETSDGSVGVAAAVAITDLDRQTRAFINTPASITSADRVSISASSSGGVITTADGSTATGGVGVGAAVAITVVDADNRAYIDGNNLTAQSISIQALMPEASSFVTEATSGAGATNVGVAGSLAMNIIDSLSTASITSGSQATITGNGDVTLTAENTTVSKAIAQPANEGAVAGSVGVGASVALNIANTRTVAEFEDDAVLTGAHDLSLSATSDNTVITTAKAGGKATGGSGVGVGGAVATSVVNNDTKAVIGSGIDLILGGAVSALATHRGSTTTVADGKAGGSSVGVGIALGLNVVTDSTLATTERDIDAGGDVTFKAHSSAATSVEATASAAGAQGEKTKKEFDAASKVNTTDNTIELGADHGFKTGDAVVYDSGDGTAIGGLAKGTTYYVITVGSDTVKLASTEAAAAAGTAIDFSASPTPSGTQSLTPQPYKREFDATAVDTANDTLDLGVGQKFITGQAVTYSKGSGDAIGGLEDGKTYHVIVSGTTGTVKLASTADNARAGKAIDLTTAGSDGQSVTEDTSRGVDNQISAQQNLADKKTQEKSTKEFDAATKVDLAADAIDLGADHGFKTGQAVVYRAGGGTAIGGLTDGTTYYVITVGNNTVKLAETAEGATAGTAIDLTGNGTGTQSLAARASTTPSPSAETSDGGVSVAAAVGVNIATSSSQAYIPANGRVTSGGTLTLSSSGNTDAT
ncbi:MAG: DUF4347 domain-containing protein, partial [Syntrophales bacterium]|nr:DUF4347 domain-containing protein [Syntrophales bacterium]MCK9528783.1 DUF4347 domain-containing protein [Syntrophales bacterium]